MNLISIVPPVDLIEAAEIQTAAMWATLRILLVPLILFLILHFGRRAG